jgi:hypothetical protein
MSTLVLALNGALITLSLEIRRLARPGRQRRTRPTVVRPTLLHTAAPRITPMG